MYLHGPPCVAVYPDFPDITELTGAAGATFDSSRGREFSRFRAREVKPCRSLYFKIFP